MDSTTAGTVQTRGFTLTYLPTTLVSLLQNAAGCRVTTFGSEPFHNSNMYTPLSTAALPTPVVHTSAGVWTFTSPDGSRVKGYIVEFGCRVRKITFVEKYMNVSVDSERTGQVATSESCFRGLGQLYRMKVWAVSGPNISQKPAVRCLTSGGQCKEEGGRCTKTCTYLVLLTTVVIISCYKVQTNPDK